MPAALLAFFFKIFAIKFFKIFLVVGFLGLRALRGRNLYNVRGLAQLRKGLGETS